MKEFYLSDLILLSREVGRLAETYTNDTEVLTKDLQKSNKEQTDKHAAIFGELDLHVCRIQCERMSDSWGEPPKELATKLAQLGQTMEDECSLRKFVSLSIQEADYVFPAKAVFGEEVEKKFPEAAFDIEESAKCLGLSRPTAAVFHLMRTLETGIAAIARCLGIPDPVKPAQRNWGVILKSVKDELVRRSASSLPAPWANPDKAFFEDVYASLDAVRNPWRNATMHVENKYTTDEADHIFVAVRGFMKKVASRMDEKGEPKCL